MLASLSYEHHGGNQGKMENGNYYMGCMGFRV